MPVCYMLQMYEFNFVFYFIARKILQEIHAAFTDNVFPCLISASRCNACYNNVSIQLMMASTTRVMKIRTRQPVIFLMRKRPTTSAASRAM